MIETYIEIWNKIKYPIKQKDNDAYYGEYIRIEVNPNKELSLIRTLLMFDVLILGRSVFEDVGTCYSQVFLQKY